MVWSLRVGLGHRGPAAVERWKACRELGGATAAAARNGDRDRRARHDVGRRRPFYEVRSRLTTPLHVVDRRVTAAGSQMRTCLVPYRTVRAIKTCHLL